MFKNCFILVDSFHLVYCIQFYTCIRPWPMHDRNAHCRIYLYLNAFKNHSIVEQLFNTLFKISIRITLYLWVPLIFKYTIMYADVVYGILLVYVHV